MSELTTELRKRVDELIEPHRDLYGEGAPVVRMALRVVQEVEEIERELAARQVSTTVAAERTGWHPETLQDRARAKLAGEPMPAGWEDLEVEKTVAGYVFVVGSIPTKAETAA